MHLYHLQQMGITPYLLRKDQLRSTTLKRLNQKINHCKRCSLHETRSQTVFATGNTEAELMIIGSAPGQPEELQGLPCVGAGRNLLNQILSAVGFNEQEVYLTNLIKCRPPHDRSPQQEEMSRCEDYLAQQIATIKPRVLLILGQLTAQFLLKTGESLEQMRNHLFEYQNIPLIVTYEPSYLILNPAIKKNAYQDWVKVVSAALKFEPLPEPSFTNL